LNLAAKRAGQLSVMRKLLLFLPLLGCSLLDQVRATTERPTLSFKEARLPQVDFQGAELDLVFLVTNRTRWAST